MQCVLVDKKCYDCPCNGLPANSFKVLLFSNKTILTSILSPTFVFLLYIATSNHKLLANPQNCWLNFPPHHFQIQYSQSGTQGGESTRKQEWENKELQQARNTRILHYTSIWTSHLTQLPFRQMKIQDKIQLLSDEKGSVTGAVCQMI